MTLQTLIAEKLALTDISLVTQQLGYSAKAQDEVAARITDIINSSCLALNESSFDSLYSTPEFIKYLCVTLNIPELLSNKIISETEEPSLQKQPGFKPSIFIETNFKRKSEPIFALAALEGTRYISLASEISYLPLNKLLEHAQHLVKAHYQKRPNLIWGKIEYYVFYYDEQTVIILSPEGKVIGADDYYIRSISRATLSLK